MDLSWAIPVVVVLGAVVALVLRYRKRLAERIQAKRAQRARDGLRQVRAALQDIEGTLQSFVAASEYLPEQMRREFDAKLRPLTEKALPAVEDSVSAAREDSLRGELEDTLRNTQEIQRILREHNPLYVRKRIAEHSKLLVDELTTDGAQQEAVVKDDVRNLVVAGAGSGKTRTLIARIRYLLERRTPPSAVLAVTFTNKATEEMEDRLKRMNVPIADRGQEGVTVSTLHALGKRVVQATLSGSISVADDRWTDTLVAAALRDAREGREPKLARLYINAILHFHRNEDETAPAVGGDKTYRTLRGEHVRSVGERIIADFLFLHNVGYEYEAKASWARVSADRDAYHPDFKLLDKDAHIEYWGINRAGEVAPWLETTSATYQQGMAWKRDEFRRAGKVLLEFYEYERTEGTLEAALEQRLTAAGVPLRPMTLAEVEKAAGDMKYVGSAIEKLLVQFLANARALRRPPGEIRAHLDKATPRVHHFGLLGLAVLERYEVRLAAEGRIDFSDMLHRAADILETGTNPLPKFRHVLVDEFQDTSAAMARFLKALLAVNDARLFAVGDDWQAIYGFAGGDVAHIVNFEKHFGPASTTMLGVNYRSPAIIVQAGSALIAHNPNQIPKHVVVASRERGEAYVHEVPDDDAEIVGATIRLIQEERQRGKPEDVLVLSRTNHLLEPIIEACRRNRIPLGDPDRNVSGVRVLSGHKAKGLEAPVVIVVNASDHLLGFPSKVENPDVLEPVRMSTGNDAAEERRLFYVAITRAMKRLHLISRKGLPSPYLAEMEDGGAVGGGAHQAVDPARVRVGARFKAPFHVERIYPLSQKQKAAGIRQSGLLSTKMGRFSFTSWASFDLEEGGSYWLGGAIKESPYRDQQRLKLDSHTIAERQSPSVSVAQTGSKRELRPRPPPGLQPRFLYP